MTVKCPAIPQALVDYLDAIFPDTAVDPKRENAAEHYGTVRVVRHLKAVKQEQEEDPHVSL